MIFQSLALRDPVALDTLMQKTLTSKQIHGFEETAHGVRFTHPKRGHIFIPYSNIVSVTYIAEMKEEPAVPDEPAFVASIDAPAKDDRQLELPLAPPNDVERPSAEEMKRIRARLGKKTAPAAGDAVIGQFIAPTEE